MSGEAEVGEKSSDSELLEVLVANLMRYWMP